MGWTTTGLVFMIAAGLAVLARFRMTRERPLGEVSLIPWTSIMVVSIVIALLMVVHAVNLLGVETGRGRGPLR